jgi:hypothetical protein
MGLGLYLKLGFKQIGTWKVPTENAEQQYLEFPVLKSELTEGELGSKALYGNYSRSPPPVYQCMEATL